MSAKAPWIRCMVLRQTNDFASVIRLTLANGTVHSHFVFPFFIVVHFQQFSSIPGLRYSCSSFHSCGSKNCLSSIDRKELISTGGPIGPHPDFL